jgi:hypothetical protein
MSGLDEQLVGKRLFRNGCGYCINGIRYYVYRGNDDGVLWSQCVGNVYWNEDQGEPVGVLVDYRVTYKSIMNYYVRCGKCNRLVGPKVRRALLEAMRNHSSALLRTQPRR